VKAFPQVLSSSSELIENTKVFNQLTAFGPDLAKLFDEQRLQIEKYSLPPLTGAPFSHASKGEVRLRPHGQNVVTVSDANGLAEKLFNSLVELKVSVAQYAMHLSPKTRHKIFDDLDAILNVEDWHEDDLLPRAQSFRDFLKWTIYSKRFNWLSVGFSENGELLAAWKSDKGLMTARYPGNGRVWWTATMTIDGEKNHVAGDCTLEYLDQEARRLD